MTCSTAKICQSCFSMLFFAPQHWLLPRVESQAMQSSGSLPAKSDDGVGDLTVNEVDATLGKAMAHSSELVQRSRQLQDHFKQAQRGMLEINRLCDQADMSILQGQTLLNRSAHRIHELKQALEKHQQVLGTAGDDKTPRRRSWTCNAL